MYRVLGYGTVYCTQSEGVHIFSKHKSYMYTFVQPRGCLYFPLKHKSAMYTFVHLSLSPPPPPNTCIILVGVGQINSIQGGGGQKVGGGRDIFKIQGEVG